MTRIKPPEERRRRNVPIRGEFVPTPGVGWQHGPVPKPPPGLLKASRDAWNVWMGSWFAAHWTPEDLPGLETVIYLFDQVRRGEYPRVSELRLHMDGYGITPKGQQDRRWSPPKPEERPATADPQPADSPYAHLRAV